MIKLHRFIALLLVAISSILALAPAAFADVPFLRWERGISQQVVLGGEAAKGIKRIEFQSTTTVPLQFVASEKTEDNFLVYTVSIPSDWPTGRYQIVAIKTGDIPTLLAGVELSGAVTYKVTKTPRDLSFIVAIFIFFTAFASTLRAGKYAELKFMTTQELPGLSKYSSITGAPLITRIKNFPYNSRVRTVSGFQTSLARFILIREGELIHRISRGAYSFMPLVGALGGVLAANESVRAGGVGKVGITIFLTVGLIAIIDLYTGIFALLAFWFASLGLGQISSMGDLLMMLAVGLGWLGPVFALSISRYAIERDLSRSEKSSVAARSIAILFGSVFGAAIFYMSQKLVNSILLEVNESRTVSLTALVVLTGALLIRSAADYHVVEKGSRELPESTPQETISIARVNSLQTALIIFTVVFGFGFAWVENAQDALIVAGLFSAPFFLLNIRFGTSITAFAKVPRNLLLESALVATASFLIFQKISSLPLLIDDRARKFLIFAGLPGVIHALYSVICDSSQRKEKMTP